MARSIPASNIAKVTPNVIGAGGTGLVLSGLVLTNSTRVPIGTVQGFTTLEAVTDFFGISATETLFAQRYFTGYDGATMRPAELLFTQYASAAVPGYSRGGSLTDTTLAELQAITGTITLSINGTPVTSGAITLSGAASFSAAAGLIETAIAHNDAAFTAAIAGTTMTVSAVSAGTLAVGQIVAATGVTAGTRITALGTGTGGTGTYTVSTSQTVASRPMTGGATTVVFDPISYAFVITSGTPGASSSVGFATVGSAATALKLTEAAGAVLSAGANAYTPNSAMAAVVVDTQNFATFTTLFQPSVDDMVAFAGWASDALSRYVYVLWDNAVANTTEDPTTTAMAQIIEAELASVLPIYDPTSPLYLAAFAMGAAASIDFERAEGRTNLAFLSQAGLVPGVTNETIANQLEANGLNFYGRYATANDGFVFFYAGAVTGPFLWADSLLNEIWINNEFQLALMTLLTSVRSIPYNSQGNALIEAALTSPIDAAVSFGAIREGVELSALQQAQINIAAGAEVADTITERGWYLQVGTATPEVRAARGSPPITFWYTDGQSVQRINLNSVEVQ